MGPPPVLVYKYYEVNFKCNIHSPSLWRFQEDADNFFQLRFKEKVSRELYEK
jgi:hypothetical protein